MKPTVYVLGGDYSVMNMFHHAGWNTRCEKTNSLGEGEDLVCFTGGSDVSPHLYGEEPNGARGVDHLRDEYEKQVYESCVNHGIPMIGICRGGQFLHVMNGGKLVQDIKPRVSGFVNYQEEGESGLLGGEVHVDHHQGILWTNELEGCKPVHWLPDTDIMYTAWYEGSKSLCFQPHPEWGHTETRELFFRLIDKFHGLKGDSSWMSTSQIGDSLVPH